jgi:phosphotransferase system HPr-like phosphotransfer protein
MKISGAEVDTISVMMLVMVEFENDDDVWLTSNGEMAGEKDTGGR